MKQAIDRIKYPLVLLIILTLFLSWMSREISWDVFSNASFLVGAVYVIVGLFQIAVDLKFYDLTIKGTKKLFNIIRGKDLVSRQEYSENSLYGRKDYFKSRFLNLSTGMILWLIATICVL